MYKGSQRNLVDSGFVAFCFCSVMGWYDMLAFDRFYRFYSHCERRSGVKEEIMMSWNDPDKEDTTIYKVVMNHEEQYSIWADYKDIPLGWKHAGKTGPKAECLAYIKEVWTDMRPLSLRKKMDEMTKNPPPPPPPPDPNAPREKSLVDRLCEGDHSVEVGLRPERSLKLFKEAA